MLVQAAVRPSPCHSRHRFIAFYLIALLALVTACDGGGKPKQQTGSSVTPGPPVAGNAATPAKRPPVTAVPPTPKPSPISSDTAQKYFDAWKQQQYSSMYDLLTPAAQQSISRDKFVARYQGIADEATITGIKPTFTPPADKQADQIPYSVVYTTALFGDVRQDVTMLLEKESDGWRVQWTPSLIFKDLGNSNLVHNFVDVPPRGAILARDGQPPCDHRFGGGGRDLAYDYEQPVRREGPRRDDQPDGPTPRPEPGRHSEEGRRHRHPARLLHYA